MGNAPVSEIKSALACGPYTGVAACPGPCDSLAENSPRNGAMEYRDGVLAQVPATGSNVCCLKGSISSTPKALSGMSEGLLRRYFLGAYRDGAEPEEIRGYALERIDTGTYVWTHAESGI